MNKKPVAMVIQRFGPSVIGGAESYALDLASQIHRHLGREVHIYTTCAASHQSWANEFPVGEEAASFGKVLRFKTNYRRWVGFGLISRILIFLRSVVLYLKFSRSLIATLESAWFTAQGPYAPVLVETLVKNQEQYECLIAITYLYWPTLAAIESVSIRKLIVPLAHDEKPFYFDRVRSALERADCVLSNLVPEAQLIKKAAPRAKVSVAGAGISFDQLPVAHESISHLTRNYVLYLGRISRGKNVDRLIKWLESSEFQAFGLQLVLAGKVEDDIKHLLDLSHVTYAGLVSQQEKVALISGAFAVVNPSSHESLSLITLEAMALGTPVLVNQASDVLAYYAKEVPTCIGFTDKKSFHRALSLLKSAAISEDWPRLIKQANQWARDQFDWLKVTDNFELAITGQLFKSKPFEPTKSPLTPNA